MEHNIILFPRGKKNTHRYEVSTFYSVYYKSIKNILQNKYAVGVTFVVKKNLGNSVVNKCSDILLLIIYNKSTSEIRA